MLAFTFIYECMGTKIESNTILLEKKKCEETDSKILNVKTKQNSSRRKERN